MLPHFYAEDLVNVMNKERRREALAKFVGIIKADIEREKKGRAGVENLAKALHETPKFGGEESQVEIFLIYFVIRFFLDKYLFYSSKCFHLNFFQAEVAEKLAHMRSMMTYLEASRFKALNVMMDLESRPRVSHSLSSYIDYSKDKQGLTAASLKIPSWVKTEPLPPTPQIDLPPIPGEEQ